MAGRWHRHPSLSRRDGANFRVAIVAARFNEPIVRGLVRGAESVLRRQGLRARQTPVYWVPGSFEIPLVAKRLASRHSFHAILCLGAVIQGETRHADHVARQAARGIAQVSYDYEVPVMFGVLVCDNAAQASRRAKAGRHNRGAEVAAQALDMIRVMKSIS